MHEAGYLTVQQQTLQSNMNFNSKSSMKTINTIQIKLQNKKNIIKSESRFLEFTRLQFLFAHYVTL